MRLTILAAAIASLSTVLATPAAAQDVKLPSSLTMTAYDTGSAGFSMVVAIGKMLKDKYNVDLRALPAGNDIARLAPLKAGRAQVSAMGVGGFFAMEGVYEFASREWGPQKLQVLLAATSCPGAALGVAKDTGVKEYKDLRGKRVGMVIGSPALNQNALALLAFGGLTKDDVTIVQFSSYGAMWRGMLNNEVDAANTLTVSGQARELDASPRGIVFPPAPAADKEGWARLTAVGPYFSPHVATCGAGGLSAANPIELPVYPYPIWMAYATQPADLIHGITKAMIVGHDAYKDGAPGAEGLAVKNQNLAWVLPYHAGAVKALQEAGAWTPAAQAHNEALLRRQDVLGAAWTAYTAANPPADATAFAEGWMAARKASLVKAGLPVIFD